MRRVLLYRHIKSSLLQAAKQILEKQGIVQKSASQAAMDLRSTLHDMVSHACSQYFQLNLQATVWYIF